MLCDSLAPTRKWLPEACAWVMQPCITREITMEREYDELLAWKAEGDAGKPCAQCRPSRFLVSSEYASLQHAIEHADDGSDSPDTVDRSPSAAFRTGELEQAVEHYSAALRVDPCHVPTLCNRSLAALKLGRHSGVCHCRCRHLARHCVQSKFPAAPLSCRPARAGSARRRCSP